MKVLLKAFAELLILEKKPAVKNMAPIAVVQIIDSILFCSINTPQIIKAIPTIELINIAIFDSTANT